MKAILLSAVVVLGAGAPGLAQDRPGSLDLEYTHRAPPVRPEPARKVEQDANQALQEIETRRRTDTLIRESQGGPPRRPDLDRDLTQGIQSRGLRDALRR